MKLFWKHSFYCSIVVYHIVNLLNSSKCDFTFYSISISISSISLEFKVLLFANNYKIILNYTLDLKIISFSYI